MPKPKRDASRLLNVELKLDPLSDEMRRFLETANVGGVCLFRGSLRALPDIADFLGELHGLLGEDVLVSIDQEGGSVVRIPALPSTPGGLALGIGDDEARTEAVAFSLAAGLAALGINVNFAPVLDVNSEPKNPVIGERSFGATPDVVARHGAAFVRGHARAGVLAVGKHLPGHGDTRTDSHLGLPVVDKTWDELLSGDLVPFRVAVEAGLEAMMTAHIVYPRLSPRPATLSPEVLGRVRRELDFDGLLFTDALDMHAVAAEFHQAESARLALAAGADLPLVMGMVDTLRDVVDRFDPDPADVRRSLARLERVLERFPFRAPNLAALRELSGSSRGPEREAARAAVRVRGSLPILRADTRLLVVTPSFVSRGAATDAELLAPRLSRALSPHFPNLVVADYEDELPPAEAALLVTADRATETPRARELAETLRARLPTIHVNLFNPFLNEFELPTVLTHGFGDASLDALGEALK